MTTENRPKFRRVVDMTITGEAEMRSPPARGRGLKLIQFSEIVGGKIDNSCHI